MKYRFLILIASLLLGASLTGCAAPRSTPDAAAMEAAIAAKIFATLTAAAPTAVPASTATPVPPTAPSRTPAGAPSPTTIPATRVPTVLTPAPSPMAPPSPTATSEGSLAIVQSATLNVRTGPSTGHAVVATAKQGDRLPVTGRNTDGSWLEVTLPDGRSGWIAASLAQLNIAVEKVAVARVIPTPPPAPTSAPAATAQPVGGKRDLEVTFINPHYNCMQTELEYEEPKGITHPLWGYRLFQVDMYIRNNSQEPVNPPWQPKRWIITDGKQESVNDQMWQWLNRSGGFYGQPVIQPGQVAGWTSVAFPLERAQWVKAVEFVWKGQVYRQEFDLGPYGNAYNYVDCGGEHAHKFYPTPTPRP